MSDSDSEDDVPLAQRVKKAETPAKGEDNSDSEDDVPLAQRARKKAKTEAKSEDEGDSSDEESSSSEDEDEEKKASKKRKRQDKDKKAVAKASHVKKGAKKIWDTLEHNGVTFPPPYEPHGVKLVYDGNPVDLSAEEEEVATMFAVMIKTDYAQKKVFIDNFWKGFRRVLKGKKKDLITSFSKCNWDNIYAWAEAEREKKKNLSSEEKKRIKAERDAAEAKYTYAVIDGKREKVGNFRVEPPGLFRGRGEHPKMGQVKRRIQPEDVIINIGKDAPVPPPPAGHQWQAVIHNQYVSWLAGWKDSINTKDWKYVQLGATSSIKGESDLNKYEKARKLKLHIDKIRRDYEAKFDDKDMQTAQLAVTVYLVDKLALRAGGEKDEELADTVGVCTLRVQHVVPQEGNKLRFDFLGKDSIRYEQTHTVDPRVHKAVQCFAKGKKPDDDLFDTIEPSVVNAHLKTLMDGLTIKVFRTYNASITLDRLLHRTTDPALDVPGKKAQYDAANKEVAILCNHQKGVSKAHDTQMAKMQEKKKEMEEELKELKKGDRKADSLRERIRKLELQIMMKEDLKTVSLGTSKINYLDPRITIAWCKKHEVPIHVVFPKALLEKFSWAMEEHPDWRF